MKITELRCSACDGTLKIDEQNPNLAECEYCHTKYMIEQDYPGSMDAHLKAMPARIAYEPVRMPPKQDDGRESFKKKRAAALAIMGIGALLIAGINADKLRQLAGGEAAREASDNGTKITLHGFTPGAASGEKADGTGTGEKTGETGSTAELSGVMAEFAEVVFGVPADEVSETNLAKIRWLEFQTTIDFRRIGYSYANPLEDPEAELTWVEFSRDEYPEPDLSCLPLFSGLKQIGTSQHLDAEDTKGLALTGIRGYFDSLEEAAAAVEDPSLIRSLEITGDVSLAGMDRFPNLETLILDSSVIEESKNLVNAKSLKHLSIDMYDGKMDFSVLGMMPWLETVSLRSESIRDLGFVSKISGLKAFSVDNGGFLTLAPLTDCPRLEELSVTGCDELKDMSEISSLTGLKKLKLELPYGCAQPELGSLTALEELYLDGFDGTGFLRNMNQLKSLTLDGCTVEDPADFEGLASLESLRCTSFSASAMDYRFVTRLPALKELDLHGTATYDDISGIFRMPTLKRLNISNMQCEIDFDQIGENTTLEALSIDNIKLYKNVQVSGGGGIVYVDWDDVSFVEHLSFLERLKGLKELSIRENELTGVEFAAALPALETIDFSDNYVTDLAPLSGLKALSHVDCRENPISNYDVLGKSVVILR